jgi:fructosamine-3-kinase
MPDWRAVFEGLHEQGVAISETVVPTPVGGGDISDAWRVRSRDGDIFLKTGPASAADMYSAEAEGLREIADSGTVRVPAVLGAGGTGPVAWLALEWLEFGRSRRVTDRRLGRELADMHRSTAGQHGWHRDNTIGSTPQLNTREDSWYVFYRDHRLGYQLDLAGRYGYTGRLQELGAAVIARMDDVLAGHEPAPSLLHGDLWSGNYAACGDEPVIFDPAVYYGDRETDLAMTRLFGGFSPGFYEAYEAAWPLAPGHEDRIGIYQLYHVLNHLNLFGRSYLGRAEALLAEALARLG